MRTLDVAFFEPWLGGSHRAFLDAWSARSHHRISVHGLAPRHWKWRQEASAWELSRGVDAGAPPDVIACSGYVDVPRLHGFLPPGWAGRPTLLYLHETQLTYPGEHSERDLTHGFSNILSVVRADRTVFNSAFHLEEFGAAADDGTAPATVAFADPFFLDGFMIIFFFETNLGMAIFLSFVTFRS